MNVCITLMGNVTATIRRERNPAATNGATDYAPDLKKSRKEILVSSAVRISHFAGVEND